MGRSIELRGTKGTLFPTDNSFEVLPEKNGQFQEPRRAARMDPIKVKGDDGGLYILRHDGVHGGWELTLFKQMDTTDPLGGIPAD